MDAERFLTVTAAEVLTGIWVDPEAGSVSLREFAERWYQATVHLKPKTRAGYRSLLDSRILPPLGHLQLRRLDPLTLQTWISDLQHVGLSSSRIRQARNVLHSILELAVDSALLTRNAAARVKSPPLRRSERRYLTPTQIERLATATPTPYDTLTYLLAYTGLRFGEAAALRRSRCDLPTNRLHIVESLAEVGGDLHFGSTKTNRNRTVAIPTTITRRLQHHLDALPRQPDALVFSSPTGRPLRYSNYRRRIWLPACAAAGLPGLRIHELRHTAASLMINHGADPKLIQAQLGHSSITVTYDVYGHLFPDRLDELSTRLDDLINHTHRDREPPELGIGY